MIIDIHGHLGNINFSEFWQADADKLREYMKDSGMTAEVAAENVTSQPGSREQFQTNLAKINSLIGFIGSVLFRLRKLVLAVPVVYWALKLAAYNREHLPEMVGIDLQSSGAFAQVISRDMAVLGPLGLTAACLLLMFCSRKASYAWAISVFTLVLPLLLLISNVYPA